MQAFIVLSALIASAFAAPSATLLAVPTVITAPGPVLSQHHSQDSLGQYAYGYNGGSSAKEEIRTFDGVTRGSYSYIDANNILQTVEYTADALNGFRAAATNLPRAPLAPVVEIPVGPEPVRDTPEVALAKAEHARVFNEAALRAAAAPEVPVAAPIVPIATPAPVVAVRAWPGFSYAYNEPAWIAPRLVAAPLAPLAPLAPAAPIRLAANGVVLDTPEVEAARAEHLRLVKEQKERIAKAESS